MKWITKRENEKRLKEQARKQVKAYKQGIHDIEKYKKYLKTDFKPINWTGF